MSNRQSRQSRKVKKTAEEAEAKLLALRKVTAFGGLRAESDSDDSEEEHAPSVPTILGQVQSEVHTFRQSRAVQEHACAIIRNLACSDQWLAYIDDIDGVDLVISALEKFRQAPSVQEQGLGVLSNLASRVKLRDRLSGKGAMHLVQFALFEHAEKAGVCAQACAALWNLVADHQENQAAADELNISQKVCEALEMHASDEDVLENAFGAISNLASWNPNNKQAVIDVNGAASICRGMKEHLTVTAVQRQGCAALWSLTAHDEAAQMAACEADAFNAVCRGMASEMMDPVLQESGCGVLRNLTTKEEEWKVRAIQAGCAERICEAIGRHDDVRVRRQGCQALFNLASVNEKLEECHHELIQADAVSRLCTAISAHIKEVSVVEPACGALRLLAAGAKAGKAHSFRDKHMLNEEMVQHVAQASFANLEMNLVQRQCLEALRHACGWDSGAVQVEAARGALATCRAMTRHSQDPVIQERGCQIFTGLGRGTRKGWQSVVASGGLKRVATALKQFRSLRDVQSAAFEALLAMPREAATELEASGCHSEIVVSMTEYPSDLKLLVVGCNVLRQMAAGKVAVVPEARPLLMGYLREFPDEVALLCASTNALAEMSIQAGQHASDRNLVQSISSFLVAHKKDPNVQAAGLNGLRAMALVGGQSLEAAHEARCIERARIALSDHKENEDVQARGLELLRRVAAYNTNMRDTIVDEGLYPVVMAAQDHCKRSPEVCRQSVHAAGTLLGFVTSMQSRQEERMRMMMQSAAKAKAAAGGAQQRGASLAFGKLVKETDLMKFAMGVDALMQHHKHSSLFLQDACHVLRCLGEASDDGMKALQSAGVLGTLTAALQKHRRSEPVNFHGFRVLWGLLRTAASVREALEAGVVEWSAGALSRFSECAAVQSAILLVVNRLLVNNPEVKVQYLKTRIIPTILQAFSQSDSLFIRGRCLATLANLASNCPQAVQEMLNLDVLELVVEMFNTYKDHAQIQCRCLQLMWAFLGKSTSQEICTEEMMDVVLEAVRRHSASEPLQAQAFGLIWNFTAEAEQKEWFFAREGSATVYAALEAFPRSSLVQKQGFEVLRSLSTSKNLERIREMCDERTIDLAKAAMVALRHDARVASAVIGLLGNLSCSNLSFKKLVFEHDVPREVLIAMEEHARDVGVQALGVWALLNFAGVSQKRARELYELGGKDRIFAAMSEHALNDTIRLYGGALMRRLELVQELTVSAANMEEEEEIPTVNRGFGDGDDGDGSASGSGASEDSELRKKIEALAKQSGEGDPHGGGRSGVKLRMGDD